MTMDEKNDISNLKNQLKAFKRGRLSQKFDELVAQIASLDADYRLTQGDDYDEDESFERLLDALIPVDSEDEELEGEMMLLLDAYFEACFENEEDD